LTALRTIREGLGEPDELEVSEAPAGDDFSDYAEAGSFELDGRHYADEGPGRAGAAPEFSMDEIGPGEAGHSHARRAARAAHGRRWRGGQPGPAGRLGACDLPGR
jgi:hypothetical protein